MILPRAISSGLVAREEKRAGRDEQGGRRARALRDHPLPEVVQAPQLIGDAAARSERACEIAD
jgi:hypothetical protein